MTALVGKAIEEDENQQITLVNLQLPAKCFKNVPAANYFFSEALKVFVKCSPNCAECLEHGAAKCTKCIQI